MIGRDMMLGGALMHRRVFLAVMAFAFLGCHKDALGPGAEFGGQYWLKSIDGLNWNERWTEERWIVSEPGSLVEVEISEGSIDLGPDLTCRLERVMSETDMTDPQDWVQTLVHDFADCTYVIDGETITMTFPARDGEEGLLFPMGGTLVGTYTRVDEPVGDNVDITRTLRVVEDGAVFVYETLKGGGGGGGCFFLCF